MKSFAVCHPDCNIIMVTNREIVSKWYWLLKSELKHRLSEERVEIQDWDKYDYVSHIADKLKLSLIHHQGGLVIDTDFICLKPCYDLFVDDKVTISEERDPLSHHYKQLSLGFVNGEAEKSKFLKAWLDEYSNYEKGKGWTYYAGVVPDRLWKSGKYNDELNILPETLSDPFTYTRDRLADLFLHNRKIGFAYMFHVAESIAWDRYLKPLDVEHIMTVGTTFTNSVRRYVDHLWNDQSKECIFQ